MEVRTGQRHVAQPGRLEGASVECRAGYAVALASRSGPGPPQILSRGTHAKVVESLVAAIGVERSAAITSRELVLTPRGIGQLRARVAPHALGLAHEQVQA